MSRRRLTEIDLKKSNLPSEERMDLWSKARVFAEEAAKRSQEISMEAAKRSQELTKEAARFSQGFVSETAKKSKDLAAEASTLIRTEAVRRADQIKTFAGEIDIHIPSTIEALKRSDQQEQQKQQDAPSAEPVADLETFGVTEELREFVKGITISTFRDFPMQEEPDVTDVPLVSNVRQDLNEWQTKHATLVLSVVKEISKLRYELCPRYMKERKFWEIYFILVNNLVARYENKYFTESKLKIERQEQDPKLKETEKSASVSNTEAKNTKLHSKTSSSSNPEHDLDIFLLGDLGSSDEDRDVGGNDFDDDLDKIEDKVLDGEDDTKNTIHA